MVTKSPCETCGSKDNLTYFENGSIWCYTPDCASNKQRLKRPVEEEYTGSGVAGECQSLQTERRISKKTCEFFNYQVGVHNGQSVHIANYQGGAQKVRTPDKKFFWLGSKDKVTLFGKEKWNGGNSIIITEGELDAMSIAEATDCKWPVVSLQNGAQSARKSLQAELDWLLGFKSIIIAFDNDEAGKAAVESVTDLFPSGRLKIASLSEKDANACLMKGKHEELAKIHFNAQEYRPDGIVWGNELNYEKLFEKQPRGLSLPYPILDDMIRGGKPGRIYTVYAGTGCGKSTAMREIGLHLTEVHGSKVANIFLEESMEFTALSYVAMKNNIPAFKVEENPQLLNQSQKDSGKSIIETMAFYRHFGSLDSKRLFNLLDYLVVGRGIEVILLDHISILVSGMKSESGDGERKDIDILVTNLRSFAERTKATIFMATQLKRKKDSYSEGADITEADSRGSGAIEHISDVIFSLNVNRSDNEDANDCQIKIIKNRVTGLLGDADLITYDNKTGRYLPKKTALTDNDKPY